MSQVVLITPPAVEPVTVAEFMQQLELPVYGDPVLAFNQSSKLTSLLLAARRYCERWTRRAFITQTWLMKLDNFPGYSFTYTANGYAELRFPFTPFQSIEFFRYVDTAGVLQDLILDSTYGVGPTAGFYGYQLERGSASQPARVLPAWARPWPPARMVPANVLLQFRCGYGGPVTVTTVGGSAALTATGFKFNPSDAPLLAGDSGLPISIPGAGSGDADFDTFIATVATDGTATLKNAPSTSVTDVTAWIGQQVPEEIKLAIKFMAQFFYEHGAVIDAPMPRVVESLLSPYRNLVS